MENRRRSPGYNPFPFENPTFSSDRIKIKEEEENKISGTTSQVFTLGNEKKQNKKKHNGFWKCVSKRFGVFFSPRTRGYYFPLCH